MQLISSRVFSSLVPSFFFSPFSSFSLSFSFFSQKHSSYVGDWLSCSCLDREVSSGPPIRGPGPLVCGPRSSNPLRPSVVPTMVLFSPSDQIDVSSSSSSSSSSSLWRLKDAADECCCC